MDGVLLSEAAKRIGVSRARVERLVGWGRIRVQKHIGTFLLLNAEDVAKVASEHQQMRQRLAGVERM